MSALVSVSWLHGHRDEVVVLDASIHRGADGYASGRADFESAHLPGARFADLLAAFSDPSAPHPFTRPTADQFTAAAESLGVRDDVPVVIYDRLSGAWAARLWWVFRSYDFHDVRVLDGGMPAWQAGGLPLESGPSPAVPPGRVTAVPRDDLFVDLHTVAALDDRTPLVCALRSTDYAAGHIPGSVSVPYTDLLHADGTLSRAKAAAAALELGGDRAVLYCGGAVNAAGLALALHEAGYSDVALYDGSLNEWRARARPLDTGP